MELSARFFKTMDMFGNERLTADTRFGGKIHIYQEGKHFRLDTGTHHEIFFSLEDAMKAAAYYF